MRSCDNRPPTILSCQARIDLTVLPSLESDCSTMRLVPLLIGLACLIGLLLACFGSTLFLGEQFAYRDAAHFYYPLYQVIQQEWEAGRVPLWDPWENGGMPLLGNPTAAVLYPGKLLFAGVPYAWGARIYIIAHVLLCVLAMYTLMRHWGTSRAGSAIAALSYGFGVPVLFQYCNVVFLVGAAWMPLGFRAVDRLVRLGKRSALAELAAVLALQTLGGDPQAAYVLGLCSAGYTLGLAYFDRQKELNSNRLKAWWPWVVAGVLAWMALVLLAAAWLPTIRPEATETRPMPVMYWTPFLPGIVLGFWVVASLALISRWRKNSQGKILMGRLSLLVGAAILAGLLSAAQLLPVLEFSSKTVRAAPEGSHEIYAFSLEPYRAVELVWPGFFGNSFEGETNWMELLPPQGRHKTWIPSLYLSGFAFVLALGAFGLRQGPPWRVWLSLIALLTFLAGLGEFGGPLFWARYFVPDLAGPLGPIDPGEVGAVRMDGMLRDGDGSIYWFLATVLPGFDSFRYPSKFLTYTAFALAALAGMGWDQVVAGPARRRVAWVASALLALTVAVGVGIWINFQPILERLQSSPLAESGGSFGPLLPEGALFETIRSLGHGGLVLVLTILLCALATRRPRWLGAAALVVLTLDLGIANHQYVQTAPQELFELSNRPRALELIEAAEQRSPFRGPFRVHRMSLWDPLIWRTEPSANRVKEFVQWERDTIQPKYAIPFGLQYTLTEGTAELYDYWFFFGPFPRTLRPEGAAILPGKSVGERVVYFPRRGFDLWNTRYFVLPSIPGDWNSERRGFAAFLPHTTPIYPTTEQLSRLTPEERRERALREDFQILRNEECYPRAWVVHELRFLNPIRGMEKAPRQVPIQEITFANDLFWNDPSRPLVDPQRMAWVEVEPEKRTGLARFNNRTAPGRGEVVEVDESRSNPQRVVLKAKLDRPGLVILADVDYPGWKLTIDGEPATILRTNRLMRGAAVESGEHELIYTYEPRSFQVGCFASAAGLLGLALALIWGGRLRTED